MDISIEGVPIAKRQLLFALLIFLLFAMTPSAMAQTSKSLVTANPRAQYIVIKRTFIAMVNNRTIRFYAPSGMEPIDLYACEHGSDYLTVADQADPVKTLAYLAYDVLFLYSRLAQTGYPESVWRPLLTQFEEEQLALRLREIGKPYSSTSLPSERHYHAFKQKMVRELNIYRQRMAPHLPKVIYLGECGAGEIGINVRTEPRNGRVLFIPVFFYLLCRAQQIDPDDDARCNRWRESVEGALLDVAGDYFYRASWPDGAQRRGRLSFTNLTDGQTVTFRKP